VDISGAICLAALAFTALLPAAWVPAGSEGPQDRVQANCAFLSVSYKANREAFPSGTFAFKYTRAKAPSLEDAQGGRYTNSVEARGLYVFDEHDARFELVVAASEQGRITKKVSPNQTASFFEPIRRLTDGKVCFVDQIFIADPQNPVLLHSTRIVPGTDEFYQNLSFPLEIASTSPRTFDLSSDLDQATSGATGFQLEGVDPQAQLGGSPVSKVVLRGKAGRRTYWVDPERGSIPLRAEDTFDGDRSRRIVLLYEDLRLLDGGGWLPFTRLLVMDNGDVVERIELTDVKLRRPDPTAFRLEFSNPTAVMDKARQLRYKPRRVWDLHRLPTERSADVETAVPLSQDPLPDMPGEVERPLANWWLISLSLGSVCLAAGLLRIGLRWLPRPRGARDATRR
jgi:hypothetical protein